MFGDYGPRSWAQERWDTGKPIKKYRFLNAHEIYMIPREDQRYVCRYYPDKQNLPDELPKELLNIKKTPAEEKKKIPPNWSNPCNLQKPGHFDRRKNSNLPKMVPEQIHESLLRMNYQYFRKVKEVKDDFMRIVIRDPTYEESHTAYENGFFQPPLYPKLHDNEIHALGKRGYFCKAMFNADYLQLGLEQLLIDSMLTKDFPQARFEKIYDLHLKLRCQITLCMAQMDLPPYARYNYKEDLRKFLYRDIADRMGTNLRTFITLRNCIRLAFFVWNMLYIYRFDAK